MPSITLTIDPAHPAFAGHFPGDPLLPGVSLLAEVIEAVLLDPGLAPLVGDRPSIGVAKFLAPVRPGAVLDLRLRANGARVHFEVLQGERLTASGHFDPPASAAPA